MSGFCRWYGKDITALYKQSNASMKAIVDRVTKIAIRLMRESYRHSVLNGTKQEES